MIHPMYLRRMYLGKTHCRLAEVVRADWLPPWAAALRVQLPELRMLEDIAHFDGQLKPVSAGCGAPGCWQGYQHICNSTCLHSRVNEPRVFGCKTRSLACCQSANTICVCMM